MKKKLKIFGISILVLLIILLVLPFVFKGKIIELVKETANNNINATLDFENADLSLLSSFPNTELSLKKLYIVNKAPFEGDTLVKVGSVDLELPFKSLFSSDNVKINSFKIDGAHVNIKVDSLGNANYDIAKESTSTNNDDTKASGESSPFAFDLKEYAITNSSIFYNDAKSNMSLAMTDFNHSGSGNLAADESVLKTVSNTLVSFAFDGVEYLSKNNISLNADLNLNLKENKYSFLENTLKINELPLNFDGFVQLNETNQEVDITFKTPSSDFKNFLALIPKVYSKNIEGVKTTGNFDVNGKIKGIVDETHIPAFDVVINSNNASFKYPDLPKSLQNIHINTKIANTTGLTKDTYVDVDKLSFKIDDDTFNANAKIRDLTENMKVAANLNGNIDLSKLEEIYPADAVKGLHGLLNADISTAFDMASIEKHKYENTKVSGAASITNFEYASDELKNPLQIDKTSVSFNPTTVNLKEFDAKIGKTDMQVNGTIKNLLGFLFNDEKIEGNFNLNSNTFAVNDFMATETATTEKTEEKKPKTTEESTEKLKIPSFLDATLNAKANTVIYDNITLKNVSGNLRIKDQTASLNNMKSNVFGGKLGFNGLVSTKNETPTFNMNLDVANFDIAQSFNSLELFKALAPIASALKGKINTNINLSGDLKDDFTPNLATLTGKLLGKLKSSELNTKNSPLLQELTSNLSFFDAKKLNLDEVKASLSFKDGKVAVKPFTLKYEDIEVAVGGNHGFDKTINYDAVFNVPAKYLGKEAEKLLSQLSAEEQNNIKVPVTALLKGSFTKPTVSTDLKSAITSLTTQVVNNQKDKLVNKGKEELSNALDKLLNKNKDTTATDSSATKKPDLIKETANDLLNGLFGSKKKKKKAEETKKDTVN